MRDYCENKAKSFPPLDDNKTAYLLKSELHLRSLLRLGYYERKDFVFDHIKTSTPESKKLWFTLVNSDICKDHIMESNDTGEGQFLKITIYAPPKYISEYKAIIQSFDSDYGQE